MTRKPLDIEKLTQRKVTVPIVLLVGVLVLGWRADSLTVGYLGEFFLEKAVAEEQYKVITEQVQANATLITGHIRTYELNENAKASKGVQDQLYNLELYIAANEDNQLTQTRKRDLSAELNRLGRVRACIIRNVEGENCASII